ncbi:MAG TPA: PqqD family protein [Gammaproteobacteria bacterium]|nr:PqqD family protein [Gammaproteobacteria bacterium]
MPLSSTISISKEVLSQEVSGETVLLDLQSESYFGLDAVGTRIWQLLQEENHLQQLFDTMLEEYDVDEKQLEKDLNELLDKLIDEGLITIESAAE